jgi:hypothetical protein
MVWRHRVIVCPTNRDSGVEVHNAQVAKAAMLSQHLHNPLALGGGTSHQSIVHTTQMYLIVFTVLTLLVDGVV